ncbi:hypothetical protein J6590_007377 [Homalodisca vitripennis]|nr:hypothetical protein J6590_007377 [Homalodisca vitripennis]
MGHGSLESTYFVDIFSNRSRCEKPDGTPHWRAPILSTSFQIAEGVRSLMGHGSLESTYFVDIFSNCSRCEKPNGSAHWRAPILSTSFQIAEGEKPNGISLTAEHHFVDIFSNCSRCEKPNGTLLIGEHLFCRHLFKLPKV